MKGLLFILALKRKPLLTLEETFLSIVTSDIFEKAANLQFIASIRFSFYCNGSRLEGEINFNRIFIIETQTTVLPMAFEASQL